MSDSEYFAYADCEVIPERAPVGGQHVSSPSGISVRHKPTNLVVTVTEHRSQLQNKLAAIKELRELVESVYERHEDDNG